MLDLIDLFFTNNLAIYTSEDGTLRFILFFFCFFFVSNSYCLNSITLYYAKLPVIFQTFELIIKLFLIVRLIYVRLSVLQYKPEHIHTPHKHIIPFVSCFSHNIAVMWAAHRRCCQNRKMSKFQLMNYGPFLDPVAANTVFNMHPVMYSNCGQYCLIKWQLYFYLNSYPLLLHYKTLFSYYFSNNVSEFKT